MNDRRIVSIAALLLYVWMTPRAAADFTAPDGTTVPTEDGVLRIPESRGNADSRLIELHYMRFPATGKDAGVPLVFLAGGPGGSGIDAATDLYPLFSSLREFGDVIALDQRGTGRSNDVPECVGSHGVPVSARFDFRTLADELVQAATSCAAFWRDRGIDIAGYTAKDSAQDLDALRRALGVEKIALLGISYGSRLAMTALRDLPDSIDRAILVSVEPLHATIKKPASLDAHVARLQEVIDLDPEAARIYPDIAGLMRRVHEKLDASPLQLEIPDERQNPVPVLFDGVQLRLLASGGLADPETATQLLSLYAGLDAGGQPSSELQRIILGFRRRLDPLALDATVVTDFTAGISAERMATIRAQHATALFGDYQSYEPRVLAGLGLSDLGDSYREPVQTAVPTLVLTGTLDGRYDPEDERRALQGFTKLSHVLIVNGGHNLLQQGAVVDELIRTFMAGGELPQQATVPPPSFITDQGKFQ